MSVIDWQSGSLSTSKWRAKLIVKPKVRRYEKDKRPRVELRKAANNYVHVLLDVRKDRTFISMNGSAEFSDEGIQMMYEAIQEAREVLNEQDL